MGGQAGEIIVNEGNKLVNSQMFVQNIFTRGMSLESGANYQIIINPYPVLVVQSVYDIIDEPPIQMRRGFVFV